MIKIGDIPELLFVNESEILLLKTYPEEKSNRLKVIITWKNGNKDFLHATEEEIEYLQDQYDKVKKKRRYKVKKQEVDND